MELYFTPFTCSMAIRITLYEIEQPASFHQVNILTKQLADGRDYRQVNPKGQVPTLRTREGVLLTEMPAVLQYVADLAPERGMAPPAGTIARYQLQEWLSFVGSEIHKQLFYVCFHPRWVPEGKTFVREQLVPGRFDYLSNHLEGREFLLDGGFTVADAYLVTMLNLCKPAGMELGRWPVLQAYYERLKARPSVARAMTEERALVTKAA